MKRRIFSLARHSLRAALRSRVVAALLVLLTAVALILPRSLSGDGTPEGEIRMLLTWTLGFTLGLLAVATLWAGCSAIADDAGEGSLAGVVVTPVRPFELLLGKWLGLVTLDALLLAAVFAVVAAQLALRGISPADLRPSQRVTPSEESLTEHAAAILSQAQAEGRVPVDQSPDELLSTILASLKEDHLTLNPGEAHRWRFNWSPHSVRPSTQIVVRMEYLSSFGSAAGVSGMCRVLDAAGKELMTVPVTPDERRQVSFAVSSDVIGDSPSVTVAFENLSGEDGAAVLVRAADGAALLVPHGTFAGNLFVAGVVLWSVLAALAALGVTCGALFSLPVAVFVASALAVIGLLSHADLDPNAGCGHDESDGSGGAETRSSLPTRFSEGVLRRIAVLTQPVVEAAPLDRLGDRLRVEPGEAWLALASTGVALPLVFAALGTVALRRREYP